MSLTGQNITKIPDSLHLSELCEVCSGKDDEDLYIVFNALYRIIIGEVFQAAPDKSSEENDLNSLSMNSSQQKQQDFQTSQEKLQIFRKAATQQTLIDIISSPRFDLLLREIFKSKYSRVQDTSCKHRELAMKFIRNFNLKNDESSEATKKRAFENIEKLDVLYNKVKQLKTEIESYHSEIDELPNRIVKKLLPNHPHIVHKKSHATNEEEENSDDQSSDDVFDPFVTKKTVITNNEKDVQSGASTTQSSESGSNSGSNCSNYDKTNDANQTDKQGQKPKKSKAATFKSKLPKKATDVLKNWFLNNIQNPYPSHEAKETLSKMTSLTRKQIQNWFTNSRKRFLEPLKKKIEAQKQNNKDGILTTEAAQAIFSPDGSQSQAELNEQAGISIGQELNQLKQNPIIPQVQPAQLRTTQAIPFVPTAIPTVTDETLKNSIGIQKLAPQVSPQIQPMIYSGAIPTNVNPGSNFVVVPWVMTQPVYSYRPTTYPNVFPINSPQFISLPQNNYLPTNLPIVDNIPFMNNPYVFQSPQPNVIDMNGIMKQQQQQQQQQQFPQFSQQTIPSTFNTVNNNVYNNVSHQGSANQPIFMGQDRQQFIGRLPQYGNQTADKTLYNVIPEGFQKPNSGMYHPRPEINEANLQGTKFIHKNPFPDSNLN